MDLQKDQVQFKYIVDRFFGTEKGLSYEVVKYEDGRKEKIQTPKENIFTRLGALGLMICGGAINSLFTNSEVNDLDFYMTDPSKQKEIEAFFQEYFPIAGFKSNNAITYRRKSSSSNKVWTIQLITRFTGHAQTIFDWFDFTITHGAYDFHSQTFEFGDRFFADLSKRKLVYSGKSQYPICAMYRTTKYVARGFKLSGATVMHIALSIVQLKIENYKQLKEQLMGIDTIFLQGLLNKKNPEAPVAYGEFISEAFEVIDRISGLTAAEESDSMQ